MGKVGKGNEFQLVDGWKCKGSAENWAPLLTLFRWPPNTPWIIFIFALFSRFAIRVCCHFWFSTSSRTESKLWALFAYFPSQELHQKMHGKKGSTKVVVRGGGFFKGGLESAQSATVAESCCNVGQMESSWVPAVAWNVMPRMHREKRAH